MIYPKHIQDRIDELHRECIELSKGFMLDLIVEKIYRIYWDEGTAYSETSAINDQFYEFVREGLEKKIKDLKESFQGRIDKLISDSEKLADELGEDRAKFFIDNIDYSPDKVEYKNLN